MNYPGNVECFCYKPCIYDLSSFLGIYFYRLLRKKKIHEFKICSQCRAISLPFVNIMKIDQAKFQRSYAEGTPPPQPKSEA